MITMPYLCIYVAKQMGCQVPVCACRYFTFLVQCKNPKACTIMLRGASKDILNEVERNLQDAMNVARNVMVDARLVPGGGAVEMALAHVSTVIYFLV